MKPSAGCRFGSVFCLLLLAGCATLPCRLCGEGPPAAPQASPLFEHPAGLSLLDSTPLPAPSSSHHRLRRIEFASSGDNGQPGRRVVADFHERLQPGSGPLVLVLPIWGSHEFPPRRLVKDLTTRRPEYSILHLQGPNRLIDYPALERIHSEEELEAVVAGFTRRIQVAVTDIRALIDWASAQPAVDPRRIGLIGFSISGFVGGIVMGNEPRLAAGVLAMGAANPGAVLATCRGHRGAARQAALEPLDWSEAQFAEAVNASFEPIARSYPPGAVDPHRVLLFEARFDRCMPRTARDELSQRMGGPRRIVVPFGHRVSFLAMTPLGGNRMLREIRRFFDSQLLSDS